MNGEFNGAVHALVCLSHKGTLASSESLAENICTNPARVRKIMAKLKKASIVVAKEGLDGGYRLNCAAEDITLWAVAEAVGTKFIVPGWRSGGVDMNCLIASGMADLLDEVYGQLNGLCRETLEQITIRSLEKRLFGQSTE